MLRVESLSLQLGEFRLRDVTFNVDSREYFVLLGASGAGKTAILELIAGLLRPDQGRLWLQDREITHEPIQSRRLGLVYQDHSLFPHLPVWKNIAYPLRCARFAGNLRQHSEQLASEIGAQNLLDRMPATLSLGESQRVALARALATRPDILLLDEPMASLDTQARAGIRSLLRRLHANGQTIIHVTHDYEEALALATRVAVLEDGAICQIGSIDQVFHHPKSRFVASFVGIRNFFHGQLTQTGESATFLTPEGLLIHLSTDCPTGVGCVVFESKDVTLSSAAPAGSARNVFKGRIIDVETVRLGVELTVDIGLPIHAALTRESVQRMQLAAGVDVFASFKSSAIRYIPE